MSIDKSDKLSKIDNVLREDEKPYFTDVYEPWQIKEQLRPWLEVVREKTSTTLVFTRASTVWAGNQSFTWFWFKPKYYEIMAWRDWTWWECLSHAWIDSNWTQYWVSIRPVNTSNEIESTNTTSVLRIFYTNAWWWETSATHSSLDSDGITINFANSAENIKLKITAYN